MVDLRRLWLLPCLTALGCSSGDCELEDDLRLFAGDAAIDCGTSMTEEDRAGVDQCALDAFEAEESFFARYERTGTDSKLVQAVAMNTAGVVKVFRWDGSPCGGGSCDPVTDAQTCERPSSRLESREDEVLPFECASYGLAQRICGP